MAELNYTPVRLSCTWVGVGQIPKYFSSIEQIISKFELFIAEIKQILSNLSYQRVNMSR